MTDRDAKEILRREYYRVVDRLGEVDPVTNPTLYKELLDFIDTLQWNAREPELTPMATAEEIIAKAKAEPIPVVDEPAEEETPAKTYSKEEVRAALGRARKRGLVVSELLSEFDVDSFPGLPESKYPELMARIGEA